jgi:Predicted solute binding protein
MYECNGDESYQVIEGDSISYTFDYFPNTPAVGEFSYIQANSFIELGKFGSMCGIFVRMEFGAGPSGELNLDIKKASFTANYDNTKVVQGSKAHVVSTTKFNWIDFGSTASATSISFDVKRIPIYPSSSPTDPPTGSPTVSSRPTTTPTYTPAPTKSSAPTASPTEKVITIRDATSGSKYCSTHFMVSTVGVMMAALFNMF